MNTSVKKSIKTFAMLGCCAVVISGIYNSLHTSDDFMSDPEVRLVKRLDELKGKVKVGRMAASTIGWSKLTANKVSKPAAPKLKRVKKIAKKADQAKSKRIIRASIQEDLQLDAVQVFNAKLFKKPLDMKNNDFSGSLTAKGGVLESVQINLPTGENIEISSYDEMNGNVFQYEDSETREVYSGMFYKIKEGSYMVTLTNDQRFAGTRIQFEAPKEAGYEAPNENEYASWAHDDGHSQKSQENNNVAEQLNHAQDEYYDNENANNYDEYAQEQGLENNQANSEDESDEQVNYGFNFNS